MRILELRPKHLSQWSKRELIDGMSRPQTALAKYGFSHLHIKRALIKRGFRHTTVMASRRQNRFMRLRHVEELRARCGLLNLEQWNAQLPAIVQGTANSNSSCYQACWKSVDRVTKRVRSDVFSLGASPGVEATWILGYWAFLLRHSDLRTADIGLGMLRLKIEMCREKRVESKNYNIKER